MDHFPGEAVHNFSVVCFVFWDVGVQFFGIFFLNNQAHFYSTARYLWLTTAEKGPFILPPLLSHLLSLLPGDPNH